jgi:hypothetical protein
VIYVKSLLTGLLAFTAVFLLGIVLSVGISRTAATSDGLSAVAGGVNEWPLIVATLAFAGAFIWRLRRLRPQFR